MWIFFRLEETLPKENRISFSVLGFMAGFKEVIVNRVTMSYTLCMGFFFGSFMGYLNSSQQIFQNHFSTGKMFTLYFGLLALVFGLASLFNSKLVEKWGMQTMSRYATLGIIYSSGLFLAANVLTVITLWLFMMYAAVLFFCFGLIFGNLNAMAMEPMGHVAGIAAAVIGAVSSIISMTIGTVIGQLYDNTLLPLTIGFFCMGLLALIFMHFAQQETKKSVAKNNKCLDGTVS